MSIRSDLSPLLDPDLEAKCAAADPDLFTDRNLSDPRAQRATRLCSGCPLRGPCLTFAVTHREHGIWGGTNSWQRTRIRRSQARAL